MDDTKEVTVEAQCPDCKGTAIYRGMCEPKGVGVICTKCKGTGKVDLTYILFTGLVRRDDVVIVCRDSYGIPAKERTGNEDITYEEFLAGKRPPNNCRA